MCKISEVNLIVNEVLRSIDLQSHHIQNALSSL